MNTKNKHAAKNLSSTKFAKYQRTYRNKNKKTCLKCETWYRNTPEAKRKSAIRYKKWKEANKEKNAEYQKEYNIKHRKRLNEYQKQYNKKHKEKINNPAQKLRNAVFNAFKRIKQNKPCNTQTLLGCTYKEARTHIESLFKKGMSWENHGKHGWHIDHIKPVSAFTLTEIHLMNHISNLQPLWAKENLTKSNKWSN